MIESIDTLVKLGGFGVLAIAIGIVYKNLNAVIATLQNQLKETETRNDKLETRIEKLEKKDRTKTEAIQTAFACRLYKEKSECPVISHIESKMQS